MSGSIVARVARTYLAGLALAGGSIVLVSALLGALVVVRRDDEGALAVARTLATELEDHEGQPESYDRVARHELAEQHWVARRIEIWREGTRLGEGPDGDLGSYASMGDGDCALAAVRGRNERICVIQSRVGAAIVVASELGPMLSALLPMIVAVALSALTVTILFGLVGRRALARNLAPLARFEAEITAVPARARSRSITRVWGSSELDSLAAAFNAMLARIDEAIAREQRFVSDAAHELRTPLTRLRAQLELAREELRDGKPIDVRLAASVRTAIELGDTTEALLAMARDTMGTTAPVELADVIESVASQLDEIQRGRVRIGEGAGIADAVDTLLLLAITNLVDNALKYTTGAIDLRIEEADASVTIVVADEGAGIPDEELARIREPFVRGAAPSGVRGVGLGLALVDHVARMHGGSLTLENRASGGLSARLSVLRWKPAA